MNPSFSCAAIDLEKAAKKLSKLTGDTNKLDIILEKVLANTWMVSWIQVTDEGPRLYRSLSGNFWKEFPNPQESETEHDKRIC